MTADPRVGAAVADAHRREWAFVLAATVRVTGDLDLAEECVQDAYAKALTAWATNGVPRSPGGWLTTTARRRALDLRRRQATATRSLPLLLVSDIDTDADPGAQVGAASAVEPDEADITDDRLRLMFMCCHPTLARDAQVALTLRLLCGLSTPEVAHAFLISESTMAARITRAKKKITAARIPYRLPPHGELSARVQAVCEVVHLLFTNGHSAPAGTALVRRDLVERARDLARMLHTLLPDDPDATGLLALVLLTDARSHARLDHHGQQVLLPDQDRRQWDRSAIDEGVALVRDALRRHPPGRFALMAAISAVHDEAPSWTDTDWTEILGLYDLLIALWPSPVVALNRAVALGFAHGPAAGLDALDPLTTEPQLAGYGYLPAARGDFLRQLGRTHEARTAYREALMLTENLAEREHLARRLHGLDG